MRVASEGTDFRTVWLEPGANGEIPLVHMIDQNRLPREFAIFDSPDVETTCSAIKDMTVRGAGAIGATAAFAMAQGFVQGDPEGARAAIEATRPTAQNLFEGTRSVYDAAIKSPRPEVDARMAAQSFAYDDLAACNHIGLEGYHGILSKGGRVLTHCNAGWLAFVDWGSALAPVYRAFREGQKVFVYADETRPRGQGGKLTAWELANEGVDYRIVADGAAAMVMRRGLVDVVIVGADRITPTGFANKIGTLGLALAAQRFGIPFFVAAPTSTIDLATPNVSDIKIEERNPDELLSVSGETADGRQETVWPYMPGAKAENWAFDIVENDLVTGGYITERGIYAAEPQHIIGVRNSALY